MSQQGRARARSRLAPLCLAAALPFAPRASPAQTLSPFGARSASGWRVVAGVGEQWESNARFLSDALSPELTSRARVEGARLWRTPRSRVELLASGSIVRFRELTEFNRTSYDFTLLGGRDLTRRASGSFEARAQSDLTTRSITPVGEGPLLRGLVAARTQSGAGSLSYRLSRAVATRFGASYQRATFDAPDLPGGWLASATASIGRVQSRATSLSLNYGFQRSVVGGLTDDAQQVTAGWTHRVGERLDASATAGASLLDRANSDVGAVSFVGGGTLAVRLARSSFGLQYQHYVGRELGRAASVLSTTDLAGVSYQRELFNRVGYDASARQGWSDVPEAFGGRARSSEAAFGARYSPRSGIGLGLGGFYRRREDRNGPIANRGVTFGVGYGWSQLRSMPASPSAP
jgi:hypothetical protein